MDVREEATAKDAYREFQFSWLLTGVLIPMYLLIIYLYINGLGDRPMKTDGFLIVTGLSAFIFMIFYGMTTIIDNHAIVLSFGIGLFRKKIELTRISVVDVVKTPWYYGYGIRLIPKGWLYNVSGPHAVELRFHDRKTVIRIGTQDPVRLKNEIDSHRVR